MKHKSGLNMDFFAITSVNIESFQYMTLGVLATPNGGLDTNRCMCIAPPTRFSCFGCEINEVTFILGRAIGRFTQSDLISETIQYVHTADSKKTEDHFSFSLTDGANSVSDVAFVILS